MASIWEQRFHRLAVEAKVAKTQRAKAVELAPTTAELADHLEAYESGTAKVAYLKEQHSGYMARASASSLLDPTKPLRAGDGNTSTGAN